MHGMADRVDVAQHRDEPVGMYADLWNLAVVGNHTLTAILYEGAYALSRDVCTRLSRMFDRLASNTFDEAGLPAIEAHVGSVSFSAPAIVKAWVGVREHRAVGCISPESSGRSGRSRSASAGRNT